MSTPNDDLVGIAERALTHLPPGVDGQVQVATGMSGLTRFANSFIHQNVADDGTEIGLTVARGKRVASASAHVGDDRDALARFVASVVAAADLAPEMADWPGVAEGGELSGRSDVEPPVEPADRAAAVAGFVEAAPDLRAAGYCQTERADVVLMNTSGLLARGASSAAVIDGIHQTDTSAGSGHQASRHFGDLDAPAVGSLAADRARRSATTTDVAAGEYEVVLAPEAVATIALLLGVYGFNAKQVVEGQSFVRLGEAQFDPAFELCDDGTDAHSPSHGFDAEGVAKRRVELVTGGVSRNLAVDRRQAVKLGGESTGHSIAMYGSYLGPVPVDLRVTGGDRSVDELIAGVERGLYVSTFNYCRVLDPMTTVTTGLTRNGTFVIEGGEIVGAASNLRFTQSFAHAMSPGNVLGVGSDARLADAEFGPSMVHAPSMRLRAFRFTGGAAG